MNCMKCGREVSVGSFCAECLADMERYPVKPGTVIQLPRRRPEPSVKKNHSRRRPQPSQEEQLRTLRKLVRGLVLALVISLVLLGISGYFAVVHLLESDVVILPGQNYSTVPSDSLDEWD